MAVHQGKKLNLYVKDYTVFDLETTGLSPEQDEIIELSALRVRSGRTTEEFSSLVNPGIPIPASATNINGITTNMVQNAPPLSEALREFLDFIGDDVLVGHNIHSFDLHFLHAGTLRLLNQKVKNDYVDTLYLSRSCLPSLRRHRLSDVADYFHIDTKGAHRALNDCRINWQCYETLGELLSAGQTASDPAHPSCPRCGGMLVKRKGKFGEFWGCENFPSCRCTRNM